ncbi:MAG: hypothetical protein RIS31_285 [Actinomycetota bacterium]|jgi:LPXTG-motif cell wall-anchored protein
MKKTHKLTSALFGLAVIAATVALPATSASATSPLEAKIYASQIFDVQRNPAYPTCSDSSTFNSITVGGMAYPFAEVNQVGLPTNTYLKVMASGNANNPASLRLYNASDEELRYDDTSSQWVTSSDAAFSGASMWAPLGQVYGIYSDGFFFESSTGTGSFISLVTQYNIGDSTTYTPDATMNTCENGVAFGKTSFLPAAPGVTTERLPLTGGSNELYLIVAGALIATGGSLLLLRKNR